MTTPTSLSCRASLLWGMLAVTAFHLAYGGPGLGFLVAGSLSALLMLMRQATARRAFYTGLAVGVLLYAPQLWFFHRIFGLGAIALWLMLALWIALFFLLAREARRRLPPGWFILAVGCAWTGLEFFRSELYYLRFSWLNAGFAFGVEPPFWPMKLLGGYGLGMVFMTMAAAFEFWFRKISSIVVFIAASSVAGLLQMLPSPNPESPATIEVAGVQLEFAPENQVVSALDKVFAAHPRTELFVLSEYTVDGPPPASIKNWCRTHGKHLIIGGKQAIDGERYFNTAFVVGPAGEIVFQQAKSVPIQFFDDGLPAPRQAVWESPWGRLGICICYDLGYARVTDSLIRQGAQALIVPTMDVADWGQAQHELHARVAPVRAAEYGVSIFRVASSGISQMVDSRGRVLATAPFPGQEAVLTGQLSLASHGTLPVDRYLVWIAVIVTAGLSVWLPWTHGPRRADA